MKILVVSVVLLIAQCVYSVPVVNDVKHNEVSKAQVETPAKVRVVHEEIKTLPTIESILEHVNEIDPLFWQWLREHIEYYFGQLISPDRYNRFLEPYYNSERYDKISDPYYNSYRYNRIVNPYYYQNMRDVEPNRLKRPFEPNFIIPYFLNQRIINPFREEFLWNREEEHPDIERSEKYDFDHETFDKGEHDKEGFHKGDYDEGGFDKKDYNEGGFGGKGGKEHGGEKWDQGKEGPGGKGDLEKEGYDEKWDQGKGGPGGKGDQEKGGYDDKEEQGKGKSWW